MKKALILIGALASSCDDLTCGKVYGEQSAEQPNQAQSRKLDIILGNRKAITSLAESKRLDGICDLSFQMGRGKEVVARAAGIRIVRPPLRDRFRQGV